MEQHPKSSPHILIVDDEPGVRDMLSDAINLAGYTSQVAVDGLDAQKFMREVRFDLVVSDVNMPRLNGFELLQNMRERGDNTPVILLTARGDRNDVAQGLKYGADDYIKKPFSLEELTLRIAAVLRRTAGLAPEGKRFTCGPLTIDLESHSVTVAGNLVVLSPTEFRLLLELVERQGKPVSKAHLLDRVWGMGFSSGATVVDTYISYLRRKIHTDDWQGLRTIRGVGFQIGP